MNRVVARLLEYYARVPPRWLDGEDPPWDDPIQEPPRVTAAL